MMMCLCAYVEGGVDKSELTNSKSSCYAVQLGALRLI